MVHTRIAFVLLLIFITSCSNPSPGRRSVSGEAFVGYFADELVLREESRIKLLDSSAMNLKLDSLRREYNLTSEDIEAELKERKKSIEEWKSFYLKVVERLETIKEETAVMKRPSG